MLLCTCVPCLVNPLNAELNPICYLLALLGGATIVVVSRVRVKQIWNLSTDFHKSPQHQISIKSVQWEPRR